MRKTADLSTYVVLIGGIPSISFQMYSYVFQGMLHLLKDPQNIDLTSEQNTLVYLLSKLASFREVTMMTQYIPGFFLQ